MTTTTIRLQPGDMLDVNAIFTSTTGPDVSIWAFFNSTSKIKIDYDANGGEGSMESTSNGVIAECTYTREGYTFKGWGYFASDTTVRNVAGDPVPVTTVQLIPEEGSQLTLYAIWEANA